MPKKYDVCVKNGEYMGKDGTTKVKWLNVGALMSNDKGEYIILDRTFNPAGVANPENKEGVFLSLFPAKDSQNRTAPIKQEAPTYEPDDLNDEIGF